MENEILESSFYRRSTKVVARDLLGKILVIRGSGSMQRLTIVETEAYLGAKDPACHTFGGRRSKRVESMYLPGGHAYVYLIYGMYYCLNVVTRTERQGEAVLIRALAATTDFPKNDPRRFAGPGKLCRELGISKKDDGQNLAASKRIWIENAPAIPRRRIRAVPRVGVDYAGEAAAWPLRFLIDGHPAISKKPLR